MHKNRRIILIVSVLIFCLLVFFSYSILMKNNKSYHDLPNEFNLISDKKIVDYPLTVEESMPELREFIGLYIQDGRFSVYVEDYSTGKWAGINADIDVNPASLLKVPTLTAVLKKVEDKELSLDKKIQLKAEDLDMGSGSLGIKGEGHIITVKGLLIDLIVNSDNTALYTLKRRVLDEDDLLNARKGLGLDVIDAENEYLNTKDMANVFRNLYFSNYLSEEYSNIALNILSKTAFRSQLPAGVPYDVIVAHKVGFRMQGGYYHDCGIVYIPERPYFICVMSSNVTKKEADSTISEISNVVYSYMSGLSS